MHAEQRGRLPSMLINSSLRHQKGVSLIELMVGMVIGLIIVAAAGSIFITAMRGGADATRSAKLNMELRGAMNTMVSEIRRAGYHATTTSTDTTANPFMQATTNLSIPSASCVLFAYDADQSGGSNTTDFFGFKKNGDAISMRSGGTAPTTSDGCEVGTDSWEKITDDNNVVVDSLTFTNTDDLFQCWNTNTNASETAPCTAGKPVYIGAAAGSRLVETRSVIVALTGHHKADPLTKISLTQQVRVRNDKIQVKP